MESWQSASDEPPPPPPSPPQLWLQRGSVSENEIISKHMVMELRQSSPDQPLPPQPSYGDLNEQLATGGCTNPRNRLGNGGYLNQGIGYNVYYTGQGIGRADENFEMLNSFHPKTPRDPEKETRSRFGIGCNVEYFGKGTGMANENVDMFNNANPDVQRAFEKQKIKEEIIAGEIARRRELEAEVREELRIEREMALRMKRGNVFDGVRVSKEPWGKSPMQEVEGLSLEDNIVRPVEKSLRIQGRTQTSRMENIVKPFQQTSIESKVDETGQEKGKNNFLAKPSADLPTAEKEDLVPAKESAYTVFGVWGVGNIEGKKVWRCFIYQVSATSEANLMQHFTGSKHRSKGAFLKAEKSAATTVEVVQISQIEPTPPPIDTAKPLGGHGTSVSTLPEKKKEKAMVKENFKLQEKTVQISGIEPLMPWSAERATLSNNHVLKNVKGILKKLTLKGFDVLKDQLLACGITSADILKGVISLIFDKAVLEPIIGPMYAQLFSDLKQKMDPAKIVHRIIQELLGADTNSCPAAENVEAICQFLGTIGKLLDESRLYRHLNDFYLNCLKDLDLSHPWLYHILGFIPIWLTNTFKRAFLKAEKSAAITVEAVQISQIEPTPPPIATAKPLGGHGTCVSTLPEKKNKKKAMVKENFNAKPLDGHGNRAPFLSEKKKKEKGKEKFAFWCEMCNAGANNKSMMEAHKKGKKHLEKLQKKFPFWCDVCKVGAHVGHVMEMHLKGRKHLTTLQEKAASTTSAQASKIV